MYHTAARTKSAKTVAERDLDGADAHRRTAAEADVEKIADPDTTLQIGGTSSAPAAEENDSDVRADGDSRTEAPGSESIADNEPDPNAERAAAPGDPAAGEFAGAREAAASVVVSEVIYTVDSPETDTPTEKNADRFATAGDAPDAERESAPEDTATATAIASAVRDGTSTPTEVVDAALIRVMDDRRTDAVAVVRASAARAEAEALEQRSDVDVLPLAGVPVAVDRWVAATPGGHPVVRRLRAAGAIVTGWTSVPEFGLWPPVGSDEPRVRNPWRPERAAGGAAAAVAAGLVPIAHAVDGFGALRNAAAGCGVFGIKPGRYTVPADIGADDWGGTAENGVLATTVADAALGLSVLSARPDLAEVDPPDRLRIGLALAPPNRGLRVDRRWTAAARNAARAAGVDGHDVRTAELPYDGVAYAALLRWLTTELPGPDLSDPADRLSAGDRLPVRTRRRHALGDTVLRFGLARPAQIDRIEARLLELFDHYDVVITPTLAAPPPRARSAGGRLANLPAAVRTAPFTPLWNLVGWPAASIPMGIHPRTGTPVAAQLAGPPGSESTLLRLAAQLERRRPWRRVAR